MELDGKLDNSEFKELEKKLGELKVTETQSKMKSCGTSTKYLKNQGTSDSKSGGDFKPRSWSKLELPSFQDSSLPFEELKHFELPEEADYEQFPELEDYESWCGIPPEFEEMLKPEELNLDDMLFKNYPEGESSDDDDPEDIYQKNLGKEYRKYIRNLLKNRSNGDSCGDDEDPQEIIRRNWVKNIESTYQKEMKEETPEE